MLIGGRALSSSRLLCSHPYHEEVDIRRTGMMK